MTQLLLPSSCRFGQHCKQLVKYSGAFQCMSTKTDHVKHALPFSAVPGPSGTLSNIFGYARAGGAKNICDIQRKRFERYGPIYAEKLFGHWMVNISDAEAISNVLRAERLFQKRVGFEQLEQCLKEIGIESGIVGNDRDLWYEERSAISTKMLRMQDVNQFLPAYNEVSRDVVQRFRRLQQENGSVENIEQELNFWAAESISTFLVGQRLGFYDHPPDSQVVDFMKTAYDMNTSMGKLMIGLPFYKYFYTPTYNKFRRSVKTFYKVHGPALVKRAIEARKCEQNTREIGENGTTTSLFEHLYQGGQLSTTNHNINGQYIVTLIIGMIGAGLDTTSTVALWTIYFLAKNPRIQEKLHQELTSVLGAEGKISAQTIKRLPYLKACVKESMRLRPPNYINFRKLDYDFEVLGYTVPAQVGFMLNTLVLTTSEKHYGSNAKEFVPERWLRALRVEPVTKDIHAPFTSLPFGYGVRMCVGRQIALAELYSLFSQLVLTFRMEYEGKEEPKQTLSALILKPDIPVLVKFTPR